MSILKWLSFAVLKVLMYLLSFALVPLLVLFEEDGWLPKWASWFQTHDNSLDGDDGWKREHLLSLNPKGDSLDPLRIYLKRVLWLYRNPCYGFARDVLGAPLDREEFILITDGDRKTSNRPGHSGWVVYSAYVLTRFSRFADYWQFYLVKQYGQTGRCLRINLGWKLWGSHNNVRRQFVFSVSPLAGFERTK